MKKEYLIGGSLGIVLFGIVAYAVMTFIGVQNSDTRQFARQLPAQPVPLEVIAPATLQPAKDHLPDQGKAEKNRATSARKAEGTKGVMITLKSGKVILADACTKFGSLLSCDMPGGAVELEQEDIESIKEIKIVQRFTPEPQPTAATAAGTDKKNESGKTATNADMPAQPGDGKLVKDLTPEQIKRLDEITERKTVLKPERERLIKEREQFHEDVKNMGMIRRQGQINDLQKRIDGLEAKINAFNDEVKKLNEEESGILKPADNAK